MKNISVLATVDVVKSCQGTAMLDPFTALSLASCIVQFVDFGSKLLSASGELHRSAEGALVENVELEVIAKDVIQLNNMLAISARSPTDTRQLTKDEEALRKLAESCKLVANELLLVLELLRLQSPGHNWQSFRKALRTVWKKNKIQGLEDRLNKLQKQVNDRLIVMMRCVAS